MEYRMYVLVERHLSPIDKGIQAAHAIATYGQVLEYYNENSQKYKQWVAEDKTIVLLNGGTTLDLNNIMDELKEKEITFAYFQEPDLDNIVTAIAILVDERVYDKDKYPDFEKWKNPSDIVMDIFTKMGTDKVNEIGADWVEFIGGKENVFLRELLTTKPLAR